MADAINANYNVDEFFYNNSFSDYAICRGVSYIVPPHRKHTLMEAMIDMANGNTDFLMNCQDIEKHMSHIGLFHEFKNCKLMLINMPVFAVFSIINNALTQENYLCETQQVSLNEYQLDNITPWAPGNFVLYSVRLLTVIDEINRSHTNYKLIVRGAFVNDEQWKYMNGDVFKR